MFLKKEPPYNTGELPQIFLPTSITRGSVEHARFLFCSCYYMRGGIKSDAAIKALTTFYEKYPHYFDPEFFLDDEKGLLEQFSKRLREVGLKYNATIVPKFWMKNFQKMYTFWDGNPALLLQGVEYSEIKERILNSGKINPLHPHGFFGFREKMVSMLIYFLVEGGFADSFHFPVPIDFHALRIITAHEILTTDSGCGNLLTQEYLAAAREISLEFCRETRTNPLDLCNALWLMSRGWCRLHPGNSSEVGIYHGRKTHVGVSKKSSWTEKNTATYEKTCGMCPIKETCKFLIPSGPYYRQGRIEIRGERKEPPQMNLFI